MRRHWPRVLPFLGLAALGLSGCGLVWDWTHRGILRRDLADLLDRNSLQGRVRSCAMEGMTRAGACFWEGQSRDVDELTLAFVMEERAPQDEGERWRAVSRCRRLGRDPRTRAYGAFSGTAAWKLPSGQSLEKLLVFVPGGSGAPCLQASYARPGE